ncbi:MAG: GNAT family N-acetyltransferase [Gemmatimonadetes bacterium]|nr:GNAT family N-acetyltransferase [Gemmatimonadota bacterium]
MTCAKVNSCGAVLSNAGCELPLLVAALGELKTQAQSGLADNVFFRAPAADRAAVRAAEDAGFRTIGIHLEFSMESAHGPETEQSSAIGVRHAVPEDASALADIADQFQDDRFHRDGRFDRGRVANLWKTSVQNALAGRAEAVLVAETDRRVAGFLVLTRDAPVEDGVARPAGRVFLIAVSPAKRRRGVGTLLLQEARCYSERQGFTGLRVGTQITNGAAIAQYEAAGFRLREGFYELSWWADVGAGGVGAT